MKKAVIFLMLQYICLCLRSQHLQFSGIPIEGNITTFQSKLAAKGIKVNSVKSKDAPIGQRIYNGKFQGYNAVVTVYYSRKTKNVYKVKVVIESKNKETIQNILDKSNEMIGQKYIFDTNHNEDFGFNLHYQYIIYPTKESVESIGTIHIKPSYTFYVPNNATSFSDYKLASYIITFEYEDAIGTSILAPIETEPIHSWQSTCGAPEYFNKFISWANNFEKHECFEQCINYLMWVLDYYKYGCVPQNMEGYEDIIEKTIISLKNSRVGKIKTAYNREYANVYMVTDKNGKFKCIEYGVCSDSYQVKLDANSINRQINTLERLKPLYVEKQKEIAGTLLNELWKEDINLTMPALIGEDRLRGEFGDMQWKEYNLTIRFCHSKQNLFVEVNFKDYKHLLIFNSEKEIDDYLNFLKYISKYVQ